MSGQAATPTAPEAGFNAAYRRILAALGLRTQVELAEFLGIRQSSVSDAKRRGVLPDSWLLALVEQRGLNPAWVKTGEGVVRLGPAALAGGANLEAIPTEELIGEITRRWPDNVVRVELCPIPPLIQVERS